MLNDMMNNSRGGRMPREFSFSESFKNGRLLILMKDTVQKDAVQASEEVKGPVAEEAATEESAAKEPGKTVGELLGDVEDYGEPDEWNYGTYGTRSRKALTDEVFHKLETGEKLTPKDFAIANLALQDAKLEAGIPLDEGKPKGIIGRYHYWKEHRTRHRVNKKAYILCTIFGGWLGIHRYYEKRYILGVIYTLLCLTTVSLFLSFTDLLIAIPIEADESGNIMI